MGPAGEPWGMRHGLVLRGGGGCLDGVWAVLVAAWQIPILPWPAPGLGVGSYVSVWGAKVKMPQDI